MKTLASLACLFVVSPAFAADPFDDIKAVFAARCVSCHGPDKQRGGLRLDRKADALTGGDSGAALVPGKPADSPLLKRIASSDDAERMPPKGDPLTAKQVDALTEWVKAGAKWPDDSGATSPTDWWSLKPIKPLAHFAPNTHPIDHFVAAKLRDNGLSLAPQADRRTLIRRLKFDLLGLPPTPDEVESFAADTSPDAYEKLVDRYLASSHFGERWARHWLDVVRFAESHGFEMNQPRPNAWPYRDWVIKAINDDMPFDQFVTAQLAGDGVGTGFLVGGPWDQVKSPDIGLTLQQRADELHDMVGTTGAAFLGLSVGCARCHNHKFDPISQTDYYRVAAVFAGVKHGERAIKTGDEAARTKAVADTRTALATVEAALTALDPLADPRSKSPRRLAINSRMNVERFQPVKALAVRFVVFATNQFEPCLDELEVWSNGKNVALGSKVRSGGNYPPSDIHKLEHLNDGRYGNGRSWISNEVGRGWAEVEFGRAIDIDRVVWGRDRDGQYADRTPTKYRIDLWTPSYEWVTVASSDDRLPFGTKATVPPALPQADSERWAKLTRDRDALRKNLADLDRSGMAYAGSFGSPDATFRLLRGDPMQKREAVMPGSLSAFGPKFDADAERRAALAKWVVSPDNPLTARVIVNRLWQYHFGTGIVDTPSDFGRNGGKPSHPELLDWLASELASGGWSLKRIHRLIVTSATYRQSSASSPSGLAKDAQSRLLWRHPPRRLEAEALRDSVLFVSGQLDLKAGGPGFDLFEPNTNYVRVYTPKKEFGRAEFRRMIYAHKTRMQVDDTFGAFDCPDGGQIAPKRNSSTTPLQSLNLLNSAFQIQQAKLFAERIETTAKTPEEKVKCAFRLAFQRSPSATELSGATKLVEAHGLAALCRAVLNANEFLYVD
ncbi:MAG TPA: PSD1 and planctomycete cytochrome C domain-containing protein [Gemmataceae bacterium]|nr:PSD1 and planctomycete cytochrome C domain-containing protein [Gemmataceae bacterium]